MTIGSTKKTKRAGIDAAKSSKRTKTNNRESAMRKRELPDLEAMQFDQLWLIHEELTKILAERINAEKNELEKRLAKLSPVEISRIPPIEDASSQNTRVIRRKYPKVLPKYFNPQSHSETWSGRGKQPRWLIAALKTGHKLEDLKIKNSEKPPAKKSPRRHNP
jgi:DNA-binding protein H-NS